MACLLLFRRSLGDSQQTTSWIPSYLRADGTLSIVHRLLISSGSSSPGPNLLAPDQPGPQLRLPDASLNEAMKALTVISSIFIPVTFIVGVYGMNFKYMPEINSPYAYGIVWGVMIAVMISMALFFKRKNWW